MPLYETVTNLEDGREVLRRRGHGTIYVRAGKLERIVLRPLPKVVTSAGALTVGRLWHHFWKEDACRLFYDQPARFPNFLTLKYIVSGRRTRMRTINRAMATLDEIARLRGADAILCDVSNWRISDRAMEYWGYQPHAPSWLHRHFIKRLTAPVDESRFDRLREQLGLEVEPTPAESFDLEPQTVGRAFQPVQNC